MGGDRCRGWGQEPGGGVDDGHLQQPRGPVAVEAAAPAAVQAISELLSVSVSVGSVDMEDTSLAEEDVEGC